MSIIRTLIRTASLVLALAPLIALGADQSSEGQRCGEVFTWSAGDIALAPGCSFARELLPPLKHAFEQPLTEAQAQEILKLVNEMVLPVQAGKDADEARDRRRRQAFATIEHLLTEEIVPAVIRSGVPAREPDWNRWQARLAKDASVFSEAEGHFRQGRTLAAQGFADEAVPELRAAKDIAVKRLGYVEPEYEARFADVAVEPETRHEARMAREATLIRYRTLAAANPDIYREKLAEALVKCAEVCFPEAYKQTGGGTFGRQLEALSMYEEAVAIYRSLAQQDPARYRPSLAWALCELGASPKNYGFPAGADTKAMDEGLSLYRTLALANPAAYRPLLADALARYGSQYRPNHSTMLDISPRIALEEEGLHLFQELAASDPQTYAPKVADASYRLALTTSTRALYLPREDRSDESAAVTLFARSRDLYVELAAGQPQLYKQRLAKVQYELGDQLGKLDRNEEALPALTASAEIMRELVSTRIGFKRLSSDFMDILARTATVASHLGNIELAKSLMQERSVIEGRQRWVY